MNEAHYGYALRAMRVSHGLTMEKAAAALKCARVTLGEYEMEKTVPRIALVLDAVTVYGSSLAEFETLARTIAAPPESLQRGRKAAGSICQKGLHAISDETARFRTVVRRKTGVTVERTCSECHMDRLLRGGRS